MNRQQAAALLELRQHLWPNTKSADNPASEVDTWVMVLGQYEAEQLADAMRAARKDRFAPNPGELEEMIDPQPTYATAWDEFEQMMRRHSTTTPAEDLEWSHPVIAAFAAAGWWRRFGEAPDGVHNPSGQAAFRAHFRDGFSGTQQTETAKVLQLSAARRAQDRLGSGGPTQIGDGT